MGRNRLWVTAAVAGMLVIAVAGWFLGISPVLDQAQAANTQVSTIESTNAASLANLASLKQKFADLATQQTALNGLRASIPEDADSAAFLLELNTLSAAHNVTLTSVTVATATVYQAPVSTGTAAPSADSTSTPSAMPTSAPAPAAASTAPASTGGSMVLVPVTIAASGAFNDVRDFVGAVQTGARLYFAATVSISSGSSGVFSASLTGDIFTLQGTSDAVKVPTKAAATPAPVVTPAPTNTATPKPTDTAKPTVTSTPTP
jgi:Tfp pilus assembly protein PilO